MRPSEYHDCLTGDCPHDYQSQCVIALGQLADELHDEIERLQAILKLMPHYNGKPVIPSVDPKDGTEERLGVVFRYDANEDFREA